MRVSGPRVCVYDRTLCDRLRDYAFASISNVLGKDRKNILCIIQFYIIFIFFYLYFIRITPYLVYPAEEKSIGCIEIQTIFITYHNDQLYSDCKTRFCTFSRRKMFC